MDTMCFILFKYSYLVYMVNTNRQYVTISVLLMIGVSFLVAGSLYQPPTTQVEYVSDNGTSAFAEPRPQPANQTDTRNMQGPTTESAPSVSVFDYGNLSKGEQAVVDQTVDNQSQTVQTTYEFPDEFVVVQGESEHAIQQPGFSEFRLFGLIVGVGFVGLALIAGLTGRSTVAYKQLTRDEESRWTFDIDDADDQEDDESGQ